MPFSAPPGLRIPYDTDGTVGLIKESRTLGGDMLDIHPTALRALNSQIGGGMVVDSTIWDAGDTYDYFYAVEPSATTFFALFFPLPTRLRGIFLVGSRDFLPSYYDGSGEPSSDVYAADRHRLEVSKDSTNGRDGTWEFAGYLVRGNVPKTGTGTGILATTGETVSPPAQQRSVKDFYRLLKSADGVGIESLSGSIVRNVRAIRIYPMTYDSIGTSGNRSVGTFILHLYGEPDTAAIGENYLQGWMSDSDMMIGGATLGWGDVPQGSSADKSFRIKNMSSAETANNIDIYAEDGQGFPTPSPAGQFLFSIDGGTSWFSSVILGAIGPGTVSTEIKIRRVTPDNAPLTTWSPKIRFDVGSWT